MNLLKAASTVSLLTLASRITGLVREQLIAAAFGASAATDAFNVAFRIPNLLRRLFAEGAFSQAFVPILADTRERHGDEATHRLVDAVASVLAWALLVTCVVGMVGAPALVWLIGSGLAEFDLAATMTRWMFPYIAFMSMVALSAGILNTWKRFAVPAVTPVLLNLAVIAAAWWGAPLFARWGLEPGAGAGRRRDAGRRAAGGDPDPGAARHRCMPRFAVGWASLQAAWRHPGVGRVLRRMAPALLGVSVAQISLLINTQIASHVGVGAVSWLTYADRLMEFPTALLGVALGVVLLPQLSAAQARDDTQAYSDMLDWGLRMLMLLALPCAVALIVFPKALVAVLFHYGQFQPQDVTQTTRALMGYGVGLMGLVGVKVLAPGFYARHDIRTPVRIAIVVLVATQAMNALLVPRLGHAGLALSIGLGALVNAGWLLIGLRRARVYRPLPGWGVFLARVLLACAALGLLLAWAGLAIDWLGLQAHWGQRAGWMAAVLAGAALLYFAVLLASGLRPAHFRRRA